MFFTTKKARSIGPLHVQTTPCSEAQAHGKKVLKLGQLRLECCTAFEGSVVFGACLSSVDGDGPTSFDICSDLGVMYMCMLR